jgi:hypothetical protein
MFKCFKFIDDMLKQLNEADEMPMEDDAEMGGDEGMEDPAAEGDMGAEGGEEMGGEAPVEGGAEQDPSQIADADAGTFVSPIAKANMANTMLTIFKNNNPEIMIPTEFETVTTENADQIIEFVKNAGKINEDEFGEDLNNI